jgi:hypothetical protein
VKLDTLKDLKPGMWIYNPSDYLAAVDIRRYWFIEKVEKDKIAYIYFGINRSKENSLMIRRSGSNFSLMGLERLTKSRATTFKKTLMDKIFKGKLRVIYRRTSE